MVLSSPPSPSEGHDEKEEEVGETLGNSSWRRTPAQLLTWTLKEVQDHIFFMVWVCGIPVHVRYVESILEHVQFGEGHVCWNEAGVAPVSRKSRRAVAQAEVLQPVFNQAAACVLALRRWPPTAGWPLAHDARACSEVLPLGIVGAPSHGAPEYDRASIPHGALHAGDDAVVIDQPGGPGTALPLPATASVSVEAGVVTPERNFSNVTALALCGPTERERDAAVVTATRSTAWGARAYWTAVAQAQRWVTQRPSTAVDGGDDGGSEASDGASSALQPAPAVAAVKEASHRRHRCGANVSTSGPVVVVVDAEEEEANRAARGHKIFKVGNRCGSTASPQRREAEVIVIESDEDEGGDP